MIVDQHGNPVKVGDIGEPQTSRIAYLQNQYIESHMEGISPVRASRMLREADNGDITAQHQLFDDMIDRDAHLSCEFSKRVGSLLGVSWMIEPLADASARERKNAAWAENIIRNALDDIYDVISSLMEGVGHGFSMVEMEWESWDGERIPAFHPRPQTWFQLSQDRRRIVLKNGSGEGEELRPFGWLAHHHGKAKTGYLGRMGICRALIWPFIYKHYAVGDFAEFLETYGLPIITGKYYAGAPDSERRALMRAVTSLGHNARAIMPNEMAIEIAKISTAGDGDAHLRLIDWAERSQSKCILGQTLSAETHATGMGSGVAELHAEVRHDILEADARRIAATLTRDLIYPLLVLNGKAPESPRRCPRLVFDLGEGEDLKVFAETLPVLAAHGVRIPLSWVHGRLRIPEAEGDEEIFQAAQPAPQTVPGLPAPEDEDAADIDASPRKAARKAALRAGVDDGGDPLDKVVRDMSRASAPTVEGLLGQVEAMLADEPDMSVAEMQERIVSAFSDLPIDDLVELLTQAFALAELRGRSDAADQTGNS
ncbi:MAG: DUF935 domain-containing protein [Azoarcus sp.]|jgi:phage gp29-like protein|nr:DUF935 domain-containing protein [Azoarcus sp.]